jgi:4-amino-4-deoxy-L-arabinose transferase-like glycosyltransferase
MASVSFFYRLGRPALFGPDESTYAQVAWEMLDRGDWVTPRLRGEPWMDKPPLLYWTQAASMSLLGETEAALRLPSALAAASTCLVVLWLALRCFDRRVAMLSSLILASSLGLVLFGRAAIPDSLLTASLTAGLANYLVVIRSKESNVRLAASFACFGAAVLAKGPVGIVLPMMILACFHALDGSLRPRLVPTLVATGSLLAVAGPWHLAILLAQGERFVEEFFFQNNWDRFFTTVHLHPGPIYYYVPVLLAALYPWSGFLPLALWRSLRSRDPVSHFLTLWIAVPFVFFSFAGSKLPGYLVPILPPAALAMGAILAPKEADAGIARSWRLYGGIALLAGLAVVYGASNQPELPARSWWMLAAAITLPTGAAAFAAGRRPKAGLAALLVGSVLLTLVLLHDTAPRLEPRRSLRHLATEARADLAPGERLVCFKGFYREALFYTRGAIEAIWTTEELTQRARERGRLLTLTQTLRLDELTQSKALAVVVKRSEGGKVLAEVRPAALETVGVSIP